MTSVIRKSVLFPALLVMGMVSRLLFSAPAGFLNVGSTKQLFIDNRFIETSKGVILVVNRPRPTGEKLLIAEKLWEDWFIAGYTSVIQESDRIHLWYEIADRRNNNGVAYAYSTDHGATWTKPKLGIIDYEGSNQNNIVFLGGHGMHVFKNRPEAPPNERYCMFIGTPAKRNKAFYSPDGLHWTPTGRVPFLDPEINPHLTLDSQNVMFWDTRLKKYVAYPRLNLQPALGTAGVNRVFGYAASDAFGDFGKFQMAFQRDDKDSIELDWYTTGAIQYPYAADAYFMWPAAYHHSPPPPKNDGPIDIQFAVSRDGVQWQRPDRQPVIRLGTEGQWDRGSLYAGYGMSRGGSELSIYYTGNDISHYFGPNTRDYCGIVSRAIYRLDGFMSLDASYEAGEFTTPPLLFTGDRLEINFDGSAGGWAKVEVLDANGKPISGFAEKDADTTKGNNVAKIISWNRKTDVSSLIGKPIKLRFVMQDAKLFAFQFRSGESLGN